MVSRRDNNLVCSFLDAPELTPLLPPPVDSPWSQRNAPQQAPVPMKETDPWVSEPHARRETRRWHADDELRVIYRQYATLYFVFVADQSESELAVLDLIQVFVEALDSSFENVCELDLIFHFDQVHAILDQIIQSGLVLETNLKEIISSTQAVKQARKKGAPTADAGAALADMAMHAQANPQALVQSLGNISFESIAERGSEAIGALQWLGNRYWGH